MTDFEQLIRDAATQAPRAHGLVDTAHRLAHRRRLRMWATAITACVALVVGGFATTGSLSLRGRGTAGTTGGGSCNGGFARPVPSASLADSAALLSNNSAYQLVGQVLARMERDECPRAAVPLAYRELNGSTVARAFYVQGPRDTAADQTYLPAPTPVTVRGTVGQLLITPHGPSQLFWKDSSGRAWGVVAHGLTPQEMVTIADGLTLDPAVSIAPAAVPPGMTAQPPVPAGDTKEHPVLYLTYSGGGQQSFDVQIGSRGLNATETAAGQGNDGTLVEINGHEGLLGTDTPPPKVHLEWVEAPGIVVAITAQGATPAQVEAFAATLVPVTADDPRLSKTAVK